MRLVTRRVSKKVLARPPRCGTLKGSETPIQSPPFIVFVTTSGPNCEGSEGAYKEVVEFCMGLVYSVTPWSYLPVNERCVSSGFELRNPFAKLEAAPTALVVPTMAPIANAVPKPTVAAFRK